MKKKFLLFIVLGLIYNFTKAQEADIVETKYRGKPIIVMTLNGKKTWVLLDTGADITVLDTSVKNKYDFLTVNSKDSKLKVPGFGSTGNQLEHVSNAQIRFGGVLLKGTTYAFDLSNVANSIEVRTGKRISAIIGTGMMQNHGFIIDMSSGIVSMKVKRKKVKDKKGGISEELVVAKKN